MKRSSGYSTWYKLRYTFGLLFSLFILSNILAGVFLAGGLPNIVAGNVAVIKIHGPIGFSSLFYSQSVSPEETTKLIKKADKSNNIKAIIFDINSGGGTPVASETIANAIKHSNKTTLALIRDVGASGAYWIASVCDAIIASKYSITGSVGVLGSYIDYYGLMRKYNVSYERLVGGKYKDIGSAYKPLTEDERAILQSKIDKLHSYFLEEIKSNRNLSDWQLSRVSTGVFFIGTEAKEFGLVDILGSDREADDYLKQKLNLTQINRVTLTSRKGFFETLTMAISSGFFRMGEGIGAAFIKTENEKPVLFR